MNIEIMWCGKTHKIHHYIKQLVFDDLRVEKIDLQENKNGYLFKNNYSDFFGWTSVFSAK